MGAQGMPRALQRSSLTSPSHTQPTLSPSDVSPSPLPCLAVWHPREPVLNSRLDRVMTHPRRGAAHCQTYHTILQHPVGQPRARSRLFREALIHVSSSTKAHTLSVSLTYGPKSPWGESNGTALSKTIHMNEQSRMAGQQ